MERRTDLDWLRIIAFALLILYHVGCFYSLAPWHAKSVHATPAIEPVLLITTPWRIPLLFIISGVATRFMMDKMQTGAFAMSRSVRLLIPFVFSILVIVPPQTYIELIERGGYAGSYLQFYAHEFTVSHLHQGPVSMPTFEWAHMWFVAYLFGMTMIVLPLAGMLKRLSTDYLALLHGWLAVVIPVSILLAADFLVFHTLPSVPDGGGKLLQGLLFFAFGYVIAKNDAFFEACHKLRWLALAGAISAYVLTINYDGPHASIERIMHEAQCGGAIVAAFGFARHYLRSDGPTRRYLTNAIFPYYIIHQTVLIVAGHYLTRLNLPAWVEAPVLIAIVAASCIVGYEIVRRVWLLRPLFGLKPEPRPIKKLAAI